MRLTLKAVKAELNLMGISIHKIAGEFKVYPKGTIGQAYFTDDLDDARNTGVIMAKAASDPVAAEIAKFPGTFGLRAFPGDTFRISFRASYVSDFPQPGTIYLYTQIQKGSDWLDFCKGTPAELRAQITITTTDRQSEAQATREAAAVEYGIKGADKKMYGTTDWYVVYTMRGTVKQMRECDIAAAKDVVGVLGGPYFTKSQARDESFGYSSKGRTR